VEAKEWAEDGLLLAATVADAPLKARLQQHFRAAAGMGAKMTSAAMVAAKEGADLAQQVFVPAPTYMDLGEEDIKLLEKARKDKEAQKKKEAADVSKTAWKDGTRRVSPYSYKAGGTTGYNYGGSGGLGGWALQQLLTQQLSAAKGDHGGNKAGGKAVAAAAGSSGGQDGA
jgi:hypothetical protein